MKVFSAKDPRESIVVSMDFTRLLGDGETILSASTASASSVGNDQSASSMIVGPTTVVGNVCSQRIENGKDGATYVLSAIAKTSAGNTLVLSGQMLVQIGGAQ